MRVSSITSLPDVSEAGVTHTTGANGATSLDASAQAFHLLQPASDRDFWNERLSRLSTETRQKLLGHIEQAKAYEIQPILASHYRTYMATGDRLAFEAVSFGRRRNLAFLAVGAGIFNDKACLGPLEDLIWAMCEETTWVTPPVVRGLPSHEASEFEVELTPAIVGLLLASVVDLMGDQLDELVTARIRDCLLARVIRPFIEKDYWWLNPPAERRLNNWTAVCSAGALACATLMPSLTVHRQAVIDKCHEPLLRYMDTFDTQGGCEEGGSYWVFAMDYLTLAAELFRMDPESPDLYEYPRFKAIAQFPPRIFLGSRQWITYSDCRQTPRINLSTLARLDQRLDVPATGKLARHCQTHLDFFAKEGTLLHTLAWWPVTSEAADQTEAADQNHCAHAPEDAQGSQEAAEACVYFPGIEWMISRADAADDNTLVLSAHAGHNGYSHNHNDVGHVSVYSKTLPLLVDLGVPVYDRDYFSPKRVDYLVASSLGHSVPQVNSQLQLRGEAYAAKVLRQSHRESHDELVMELSGAYGKEAGLRSLVRHVSLHRNESSIEDAAKAAKAVNAVNVASAAVSHETGMVVVADEYWFEGDDPSQWDFVSALITTGRVTPLAAGALRIDNGPASGVLSFDANTIACDLQKHPGVVLSEGVVDCTRICLSCREPAQQGRLLWTIRPTSGTE